MKYFLLVSSFLAIVLAGLFLWHVGFGLAKPYTLEQLDRIPIGGAIEDATAILGFEPRYKHPYGDETLLYTPRYSILPSSTCLIVTLNGGEIREVYVREIEWFIRFKSEGLYVHKVEQRFVSDRFLELLRKD